MFAVSRVIACLAFRASLDKNGRDVDYFLKGLRNLGKLYDYDEPETMDLIEFQNTLDRLDPGFDVASKLQTVSVNMDLIDPVCVL